MTASAFSVRPNRYVDSVSLLRVANRLAQQEGVVDAAAMLGTPANLETMTRAGFAIPSGAHENDLVVSVLAHVVADAERALATIDDLLGGTVGDVTPTSLDAALAEHPQLNLASISLPAGPAVVEARHAIDRGLHVFLFTSGISLDDELDLKRRADRRGVIVMGPDCGTAIIGGAGLGFSNQVRRGPVGVIGAAGTGIQAITCLLHERGRGISHAIGTGGRDLSDAVGGITTFVALSALDTDPSTELIVLVAKSIGASVHDRLRAAIARTSTPVVTCLLDATPSDATTLRDAAAVVAARIGPPAAADDATLPEPSVAPPARSSAQRTIRGVFAGGSFCAEAQTILRARGMAVTSNAPIDADVPAPSRGAHQLLDLGAPEFTRGRPHPMIDPRFRCERIREAGRDPSVAVLLLDVILGYGASADPAGDLADSIVDARTEARATGRDLTVVASICGTELDPQGLAGQAKVLTDAGVTLLPTSADASSAAADLVEAIG